MRIIRPGTSICITICCLLPVLTVVAQSKSDNAAQIEPVQIQLHGNTHTWTDTKPVFETDDESKFQTQRYGEEFSYVVKGLPAGIARLKLGLCELKYKERGKRIFDISVNGRLLYDDFDILAWAMPGEALVLRNQIRVPEDRPLTFNFSAETEQAKMNFLRIYTDDWVLEIGSHDSAPNWSGKTNRDAPYMHGMYETCISKFGSRLCINPRPQKKLCRQSALGHADYNVAYFEDNPDKFSLSPTAVYYAICSGNGNGDTTWYSLPFNGELPAFPDVNQQQTLTSLSYVCRAPDLPVEVTYTFRAPFYPENVRLSTAPFILLDVKVTNLTTDACDGSVIIGTARRSTEADGSEDVSMVEKNGCIGVEHDLEVFQKQTKHAWLVDKDADAEVTAHADTMIIPPLAREPEQHGTSPDGRAIPPINWATTASGLQWDYQLQPRATKTHTLLYAGWVDEPIIEVQREPYRFKYVQLFDDIYDVARFAFDRRDAINRKTSIFEATVADATICTELKQFLAFAFQSWVQNTFCCSNEDGNDCFSVWEGCCKFHSTVDVEYNVAPLYFAYWPRLMKITLYQWTDYINNGVLSHDMGMGLEANGMEYGHDMEIEENTNFVLLLYRYWRRTGDDTAVKELFQFTTQLIEHVISCDTDGDGFHDEGTSNTIDQGSEAIQYAPNQTYLAVRAISALECGAQMAASLGNTDLANKWRHQADITAETLQKKAWLGDHYAIALNDPPDSAGTPTSNNTNSGTAQPDKYDGGYPGSGQGMGMGAEKAAGYSDSAEYDGSPTTPSDTYTPPQGWDGYSIYATNGLLYPMQSGCKPPGIDLQRMRTDIQQTLLKTEKKYGCPHSDHESNMWVSQNLWRDMAAAYLGIDLIDNAARYMRLQKHINRNKRGCFTDVYVYGSDHISLDYYPRGTAAFGLIPALAGLQVDRVSQTISVSPLREHLRIPLLAYADWSAEEVPWLQTRVAESGTKVNVEGDIDTEIQTRPHGQPW